MESPSSPACRARLQRGYPHVPPPEIRCAIQITGTVEDQTAVGCGAIRCALEVIERGLGPTAGSAGTQLENRTAAAPGSTTGGRAIKITGMGEDDACLRSITVSASCEVIQSGCCTIGCE